MKIQGVNASIGILSWLAGNPFFSYNLVMEAVPLPDKKLCEQVAAWYLKQSEVDPTLPRGSDGLRQHSAEATADEIRRRTEDGIQVMKCILAGVYGPNPFTDPEPDEGPFIGSSEQIVDLGHRSDW
jgi:hypothetical protein